MLYNLYRGHPTFRLNQNDVNTCMNKEKILLLFSIGKELKVFIIIWYTYRSQMYFFPLCLLNCKLMSRDKFFICVK